MHAFFGFWKATGGNNYHMAYQNGKAWFLKIVTWKDWILMTMFLPGYRKPYNNRSKSKACNYCYTKLNAIQALLQCVFKPHIGHFAWESQLGSPRIQCIFIYIYVLSNESNGSATYWNKQRHLLQYIVHIIMEHKPNAWILWYIWIIRKKKAALAGCMPVNICLITMYAIHYIHRSFVCVYIIAIADVSTWTVRNYSKHIQG